MVLRLWVTQQLPVMLIPACLQRGLCLFCASPAVNKDILGIFAIFKGRLHCCVLLRALPAKGPSEFCVDAGRAGTALGAATLAGFPITCPPYLCGEPSSQQNEPLPCIPERRLKCWVWERAHFMVVREAEVFIATSSMSEKTSSQIGNSNDLQRACFTSQNLRNAFSLSDQNGKQRMFFEQIIVFLMLHQGFSLFICYSPYFILSHERSRGIFNWLLQFIFFTMKKGKVSR